MNKNYFYITTPIYYVNDVPHIGHAYTTIVADTIARFKRLNKQEVFFLTGTDEHGQKVERAAFKNNLQPKEFVDRISERFKCLARTLDATCNDFIRTTEIRHINSVIHLWNILEERNHIYLGKYSGWYSIRDEAFYQENELIDGKAPNGSDVDWITEESYFFDLSLWKNRLLEFYSNNPEFVQPKKYMNEVIKFVERGLKDISISRTSFSWGVKAPKNINHTIYVWFDALSNYISAIGYPNNFNTDLWKESTHVIGKDILLFHAVYWPAFLMASEINPPKRILVHGWWTMNKEKISKSIGNTVDPIDIINKYGLDAMRYFLLKEISIGQDGDFSVDYLITRVNSDLSNRYGNLVYRVLAFVEKFLDSRIPKPGILNNQDEELITHTKSLLIKVQGFMDRFLIHEALNLIWRLIDESNQYIDKEKPWVIKNYNLKRLDTILYVLLEAIRCITIVMQAFIPETSKRVLDQLLIPIELRSFDSWDRSLISEIKLPKPIQIFSKIESKKK